MILSHQTQGTVKVTQILILVLIFLALVISGCGPDPLKKLDPAQVQEQGAELFATYGCHVCHSLEGQTMYGPSINGIYGKKIIVYRGNDSLEVTVNREYLKKSILDPEFEKVSGYQDRTMPVPVMPENEAKLLVEYLIQIDP